MTKTPLSARVTHALGDGLFAKIQLVRCQTPDLGPWEIYEWEIRQGEDFIARGSFPYGRSFILATDVSEQLRFTYVDEPNMEFAGGSDGPSDADPGL